MPGRRISDVPGAGWAIRQERPRFLKATFMLQSPNRRYGCHTTKCGYLNKDVDSFTDCKALGVQEAPERLVTHNSLEGSV